jgi:hypothetical protein
MAVAPAATGGPERAFESPVGAAQARGHDQVNDPGEFEQPQALGSHPLPSASPSAPHPSAKSAPNRFLARGAGDTFVISEAEASGSFDPLRFLLPNMTNLVLSSPWGHGWNRSRLHPGDVVWLDADPARRPGSEKRGDALNLNESEKESIERELMEILASLGPEYLRPGLWVVRPLEGREAGIFSSSTEERNRRWGVSFEVTNFSLGFVQWTAHVTIRILPLSQAPKGARRSSRSRSR